MSEISTRRSGVNDAPVVVRTDLAVLLSDYTNSQRRCMYKEQSISRAIRTSCLSLDNNRLESLEREMVSLKGQVNQVFTPMEEHELNRTFTTKKTPASQPTSARVSSPSRIPLPITPRKSSADDRSAVSANGNTSMPRPPPTAPPMSRSKTFHNNPSSSSQPSNFSDEANLLRAYKMHLEQTLHKDSRVPNYNSLEDVIKANEVFLSCVCIEGHGSSSSSCLQQLLLENDRLRSELNRLKTESILLVRSMKPAGAESSSGNERVGSKNLSRFFQDHLFPFQISAERERQELAMELARQVEENKRLRKSLLAQSTKFLSLRQSNNNVDLSSSTSIDPRLTPVREYG